MHGLFYLCALFIVVIIFIKIDTVVDLLLSRIRSVIQHSSVSDNINNTVFLLC